MPLNDGSKHLITQEMVDKWTMLYPAVNVLSEIKKMIGWLDGNPKNRKTKQGIAKFINGGWPEVRIMQNRKERLKSQFPDQKGGTISMMPQDMIQLFQMIDVDYPTNQIAKSIEDRRVSIARWFQRLSNHEANKVFAACEVYLARSPKFAPNWQDLVQILAERQNGLIESADVAWGKLMRAVSAFGWSQKGRARKELGERIWKIVENFDWMHYCNMPMDNESTYYAQFRSSYEAQIKRETEQAQVPPAAAAVLDRIGQKISTINSDSIAKKP